MHNDFYIVISIMFDKFILTLRICVCVCACVCIFELVFLCGRDVIWKGTLLCVDVIKIGRVHFCVSSNNCESVFSYFFIFSTLFAFSCFCLLCWLSIFNFYHFLTSTSRLSVKLKIRLLIDAANFMFSYFKTFLGEGCWY